MKKLCISFLSLLVFGCVTPVKPYNDISQTTFSEPELQKTVTKNIGDNLITQGILYTTKAVCIPNDLFDGYLLKGTYQATGTKEYGNKKHNSICFADAGISGNKTGMTDYYLEYFPDDNSLYYTWYSNVTGYGRKEVNSFKIIDTSFSSPDSFQQSLIYLGKSGTVIKFGYREFFENHARPAFSNEISYDLKESDIIGYKHAKIKVISATNTEITYEVLNYFN